VQYFPVALDTGRSYRFVIKTSDDNIKEYYKRVFKVDISGQYLRVGSV